MALSKAEAELLALSLAIQESAWLQQLHTHFQVDSQDSITITISLSENNLHTKMKHISIKHKYVKDQTDKGHILVKYCPTQNMTADIFILHKRIM